MGPRLRPVTEPDPQTAEILALAKPPGIEGPAPNVFRTLAHHPRLLKRFNVLGGFFLTRGRLPERDRELVILRAAWRARSEYEFGAHTVLGRLAGLRDEEIGAAASADSDWPARDRALVAVADELHDRGELTDATWDALDGFYDDQQVIEVILLAGFYRMLAGLLNTLRVERDAGFPGWPPAKET